MHWIANLTHNPPDALVMARTAAIVALQETGINDFEALSLVNKITFDSVVDILVNLEDPEHHEHWEMTRDNVGAIMRSSEVFGWKNVLLPRRGAPLVIPSVAKSSAGACEHLRIACNCSPNQYVKIALDEGYSVVSLDGGGKATLESVKAAGEGKLLLVVGGENSGVSQFILNSSNYIAAIPQSGHVNSLNASVAAGVALYVLRA